MLIPNPCCALSAVQSSRRGGNRQTGEGQAAFQAPYISYRLSSYRFCDSIAVFDNGSVVQQGSHEELVSQENGKYHELWYAQAQYYTKEANS